MADATVADLGGLDRDVARGMSALGRWRTSLVTDVDVAAGESPLEPVRRVAGKSTYDALAALTPSLLDVPLRDALRGWVAALVLARVQQEDDVAWARVAGEAVCRFGGDPPELASWRVAWRSLACARTVGDTRLWLDATVDAGPRLADAARDRGAKRLEAARRLGLEHPWAVSVDVTRGVLREGAEALLRATDDIAAAVRRAPTAEGGGVAAVLHAAVARDAGEGWPAHLAPRWLEELFQRHTTGLRLAPAPLPRAVGASSFARALAGFGFALRQACVARTTPFALGFEPGDRDAHRLACVFGALPLDVAWQTRALHVGQRAAHAQRRVLGATMLLDTRLAAARLLLGDEADLAPRDRFEELGARVLGAPLDPALRGAWPTSRDDEAARLVARIESPRFANDLRERFDVDWFDNPRAWTHLRAVSALPRREKVEGDALLADVQAMARGFEALLG